MIHPSTELRFISDRVGKGVFATERIPRGTITWVRCAFDRAFAPAEVAALGEAYAPIFDHYAYVNGRGEHVLCWDLGRYMNHSCRPAVISPGFDLDVAVRDIEAGEELTCDYAMLNLDRTMACACGAASCRREVRPDDADRLLGQWDELVRGAFSEVLRVAQPLWPFLKDADLIRAAARGERDVPSCGVHLLKRS
jgi:hypothetical protein